MNDEFFFFSAFSFSLSFINLLLSAFYFSEAYLHSSIFSSREFLYIFHLASCFYFSKIACCLCLSASIIFLSSSYILFLHNYFSLLINFCISKLCPYFSALSLSISADSLFYLWIKSFSILFDFVSRAILLCFSMANFSVKSLITLSCSFVMYYIYWVLFVTSWFNCVI